MKTRLTFALKCALLFAALIVAPFGAHSDPADTGDKSVFETPADMLKEAIDAMDGGRFHRAFTLLSTYMQDMPDHRPDLYYQAAKAGYGSGFYRRANALLVKYEEMATSTLYATEAKSLKARIEKALAAMGSSDESAFAYAQAEHTIFAYAAYARNYPEGSQISVADDLSYKRAGELNTETSYNRYLEFWPDGKFRAEALKKADIAAMRVARKLNTVSAYRAYLEDYPSGAFKKEVMERMTAQAFYTAKTDGSTAALKRFMSAYPKSSFEKEAEVLLAKATTAEPLRALSGPTVNIPIGFFVMKPGKGSTQEQIAPVRILKPFVAAAHEVTFAQYDACISAGGCGDYSPSDEGWGRGKRPVMNVNRADIDLYINWFNGEWARAGGKGVWRLPSEAEWTYMARGRAGQLEIQQASIKGGTSTACDDCEKLTGDNVTLPVGTGKPNSYGLYDMLGNVSEWVADCWLDDPNAAPKDAKPYLPEGSTCDLGTVRGGKGSTMPALLAREARTKRAFTDRTPSTGFRLVLEN